MSTRRRFLGSVAGTATLVGLAGCLGSDDDDNEQEDISPDEPLDTDDEFLLSMADPSDQVAPLYFAGYQYRLSELGEIDPTETVPALGGVLLEAIEDDIEGTTVSDIESVIGSTYNSVASGGVLEAQPLPSGQTVHTTGSFDAAPFLDWLEDSDGYHATGEQEGYERYIAEIQDGDGFQIWAVGDGRVVIVNRTDVTQHNPEYEAHEAAAEAALAVEFDQLDRDDAPIANSAPAFVDVVQTLADSPIRAGAAHALIPKGADTGTEAFDDVVRGVVGTGVATTATEDGELQRAVSYLEPEMASEETVSSAFEAAETEEIPHDAWEFDTTESTITARASLDERPSTAMYQTGLPVPGYDSLFNRVDPGELGREPTPRLFFEPAIDDDGVMHLTHAGNETVENLRVRYVHDGEEQRESWEGEISEGDEFTSDNPLDSDTQAWVTWRPDTTDAAVLIRFQV